jgi:hypothetical protein
MHHFLGALSVVQGKRFGHDHVQKSRGSCGMMRQSVRHGKIALLVDRDGTDMVEVRPDKERGLVGRDQAGATDVLVPCGLAEPVTKLGGAIVHSSVVALSNQSSVCSVE